MSIVLDGTAGITTPAATATGLISGATNYTGFKNLLIDAGFTINQRAYVSGATLASGSYGHDRWKAGASGGDYTFTQLASSTTITIASGKSLIQVIEDKNVNGTSFVLSWTGTAQARYAVNGATPSGSYAASPILITGQTVGTTMSVEFNTGTLSKPQLELGSTATSFDVRDYGTELAMCQRYCQVYNYAGSSRVLNGGARSSSGAEGSFNFSPPMRDTPTVTIPTVGNGTNQATFMNGSGSYPSMTGTASVIAVNPTNFTISQSGDSGFTTGQQSFYYASNGCKITLTAEL
jgi:hypothetical protein